MKRKKVILERTNPPTFLTLFNDFTSFTRTGHCTKLHNSTRNDSAFVPP
jgi:hypothetical protein